jgi:hypothetical protein
MFERLVTITKENERKDSMKYKGQIKESSSSSQPSTPTKERRTPEPFYENDLDGLKRPHRFSSPPIVALKPFGLPAISELLRVLVSLIDPSDRTHTDTLHRPLALLLISRGLEIGGKSLAAWIAYAGESTTEAQSTVSAAGETLSAFNAMKITPERDRQASVICVDGTGANMQNQDGSPALVDVSSPIMESAEETYVPPIALPTNDTTPLLQADAAPATDVVRDERKEFENAEQQAPIASSVPTKETLQELLIGVEGKKAGEDVETVTIDTKKIANGIKKMIVEQLCRYMFQVVNIYSRYSCSRTQPLKLHHRGNRSPLFHMFCVHWQCS